MSVTSTGTVSWTPGGPMFDRNRRCQLGRAPEEYAGHQASRNDHGQRREPETALMRSNSGIPVGNNSIDVQDFDGNGSKEVLVGTYESIYLLGQSGSGYAQTWVYSVSDRGEFDDCRRHIRRHERRRPPRDLLLRRDPSSSSSTALHGAS